jgi:hypothetical protein
MLAEGNDRPQLANHNDRPRWYNLNGLYFIQSTFTGLWMGVWEELTLLLGCANTVEAEMEAAAGHALRTLSP